MRNDCATQVNDKLWKDGLTSDGLEVLERAFQYGGRLQLFATETEVGYLDFVFPNARLRAAFESGIFRRRVKKGRAVALAARVVPEYVDTSAYEQWCSREDLRQRTGRRHWHNEP